LLKRLLSTVQEQQKDTHFMTAYFLVFIIRPTTPHCTTKGHTTPSAFFPSAGNRKTTE